jgi:hypothetical protein
MPNIIINGETKNIQNIIVKKLSNPNYLKDICILKDSAGTELWKNHNYQQSI